MACKNPTEPPRALDRAVLSLPAGVRTGRIPPPDDLSPMIEHFWWVQWATERAQTSEVLSYPSVHLVFEDRRAEIVGIVRKKFTRRLEGEGTVFGIKFRPAMFRQCDRAPACRLTDRTVPLDLAVWDRALVVQLLHAPAMPEKTRLAEMALRLVARTGDRHALPIRDLVEHVRANPEIRTVADLVRTSGWTERTLQRLFRDYLGVSPKWVLRRFRLQEAAECLARETGTIASVAAELGYCDQAHFARDFKSVVGLSPRQIQERARNAP
ncbi:helix-turn-helix domain-containing protein [Gluconacetobacter sacchari]|uniref:Helix-turn-helix transcriptional regulator n=2 Tax=Gluconacetobacter sacchari TaxID=92759 RepID=A0A7W4NP74_9PROT|nr:AraC family transcriptional regulator [Gluconacetobacter sacchari]MBB2161367.1 helix-turn-helix transcriptional regulator [Gluconacetobacter sacchari]GBQ29719.1 AraC family transcriptional regulator [Gluconacetobacter sacchari DSM 12717]